MLWLKYSQDHILSQVTCPQTQPDAHPFWCLSNICPNPGGGGWLQRLWASGGH